jgi:hypothetical protein
VKNRRFILPVLSILFGFAFLIGSTGITIIIHNCAACGDLSMKSGVFLSSAEPEDHCCEAAENHCTPEGSITVEGTCCHFKVEKLKLTDYTPVLQEPVSVPAESEFFNSVSLSSKINEEIILPHDIQNKHGGRYLITVNCQFIS